MCAAVRCHQFIKDRVNTMKTLYKYYIGVLVVCAVFAAPAAAQDAEPGTLESLQQSSKTLSASKALDDIFATESGLISVSIDGVGSNDDANGADVQVDKPLPEPRSVQRTS